MPSDNNKPRCGVEKSNCNGLIWNISLWNIFKSGWTRLCARAREMGWDGEWLNAINFYICHHWRTIIINAPTTMHGLTKWAIKTTRFYPIQTSLYKIIISMATQRAILIRKNINDLKLAGYNCCCWWWCCLRPIEVPLRIRLAWREGGFVSSIPTKFDY